MGLDSIKESELLLEVFHYTIPSEIGHHNRTGVYTYLNTMAGGGDKNEKYGEMGKKQEM